MSTITSYAHIVTTPGQPARLERIPRVRVSQIVADYLTHGWSVEEMCWQHPYLKPSEAYSAMSYYYDHTDEIEAELREELAQSDSARARRGVPNLLKRLGIR